MATQSSSTSRDVSSALRSVIRGPVRPQTYRNLCYLGLMFPLGICYFTLLMVGFFTGVPLLIVGLGVPILLGLLVVVVELAGLERLLIHWLLDVDIPTPGAETDGTRWDRVKRLITDLRAGMAIVYLLSEFVYGTLVFGFISSLLATAVNFVLAPVYYTRAPVTAYGPIPTTEVTLDVLFGWDSLLVGLTTTFQLGSWQIETLPGALLVAAVGVILFVIVLQLANVFARLWGQYARRMLTVPRYWSISGG